MIWHEAREGAQVLALVDGAIWLVIPHETLSMVSSKPSPLET
jgi:hypothetical protein